MTNLNRNSIEQLIAGLSKQAAYIDATKHIDDTLCKTNTPILIGDVLERIWSQEYENQVEALNLEGVLCFLWKACGFTRSLQEIASEIEWEQASLNGFDIFVGDEKDHKPLEVPKPSPQADLFKFLLSLNLIE